MFNSKLEYHKTDKVKYMIIVEFKCVHLPDFLEEKLQQDFLFICNYNDLITV